MEKQIFLVLSILSLCFVLPSVSAQEYEISQQANQKSVEVQISENGNVHVKHVVISSNYGQQLNLMDGTIKNLSITDENGNEKIITMIGNNNALLILPSHSNIIVEYDLEDILEFKNDYWTLEFLYLESTKFFMPENLEIFYVNDKMVSLGEKGGFVCHGCQMILEYSFEEPKFIQNVKWEEQEFDVEIISHLEINNFVFDQPGKSLTFEITEENKFLTIVIPLELLWEPYTVFLDGEIIKVVPISNNGIHVSLNMKPNSSGEISIIGTTVVPEFPIIAPLAIGFLMLLTLPFLKKFNLH